MIINKYANTHTNQQINKGATKKSSWLQKSDFEERKKKRKIDQKGTYTYIYNIHYIIYKFLRFSLWCMYVWVRFLKLGPKKDR